MRNSSGYKGVHQKKGRWAAAIKVDRKTTHLGYFDNKQDAARMYNFWALDLYGDFARPNIIEEETA